MIYETLKVVWGSKTGGLLLDGQCAKKMSVIIGTLF